MSKNKRSGREENTEKFDEHLSELADDLVHEGRRQSHAMRLLEGYNRWLPSPSLTPVLPSLLVLFSCPDERIADRAAEVLNDSVPETKVSKHVPGMISKLADDRIGAFAQIAITHALGFGAWHEGCDLSEAMPHFIAAYMGLDKEPDSDPSLSLHTETRNALSRSAVVPACNKAAVDFMIPLLSKGETVLDGASMLDDAGFCGADIRTAIPALLRCLRFCPARADREIIEHIASALNHIGMDSFDTHTQKAIRMHLPRLFSDGRHLMGT